jgi:hypothetical protein
MRFTRSRRQRSFNVAQARADTGRSSRRLASAHSAALSQRSILVGTPINLITTALQALRVRPDSSAALGSAAQYRASRETDKVCAILLSVSEPISFSSFPCQERTGSIRPDNECLQPNSRVQVRLQKMSELDQKSPLIETVVMIQRPANLRFSLSRFSSRENSNVSTMLGEVNRIEAGTVYQFLRSSPNR